MTHVPDPTEGSRQAAKQRADTRALERLAAGPVALSARYDRRIDRIVVGLRSGIEISFEPKSAQGLEDARPAQLGKIEITPSGLGLHFPQLDADVYLPALLQGVFGSRSWMAQAMGQAGGMATTDAKARAARENGLRGGRPRKPVPPEAS